MMMFGVLSVVFEYIYVYIYIYRDRERERERERSIELTRWNLQGVRRAPATPE